MTPKWLYPVNGRRPRPVRYETPADAVIMTRELGLLDSMWDKEAIHGHGYYGYQVARESRDVGDSLYHDRNLHGSEIIHTARTT